MTFREISESILSILQQSAEQIGCPAANIKQGSMVDMPSSIPFVWVYFEPGKIAEQSFELAKGVVTIFAGARSPNPNESRFRAIEFTEKAFRAICYEHGLSIQDFPVFEFDSYYDGTAVSLCSFNVIYELTRIEQ